MPVTINMKDLLEAGVHFGHQAKRWNPKMKPYIFGARNGIHIIDLQQTVKQFQIACEFLEGLTSRGGHVLFVGTKKMAKEIVATEARRAGMYFVNSRWLGGTLTNFQTIKQSIHRLKRIEKMASDGTYDKLTKKEVLNLNREREKLERDLGGIKDMPGLPRALFIVDSHKEDIAVKEARRLNIPVVAIADTNADPDVLDHVIPGNDDSMKSLQLFISTVAEACLLGKSRMRDKSDGGEVSDSKVEVGQFFDDSGNTVSVSKKSRLEN